MGACLMTETKVVVCGALGRMGPSIIAAVLAQPGLTLSAVLERPGDPRLGQKIRPLPGNPSLDLVLTDSLKKVGSDSQVYIDFTTVEASLVYLEEAVESGLAAVIGTTGFSREQQDILGKTAKKIPVLWAPNMSFGVNAMFHLAAVMTKMLGPDYDIEIVETHHRLKKDAPSGTALKLHEIMSLSRDLSPEKTLVAGRQGQVGERTNDEIGVMAVRGGDIIGDHTIYFCGPGERLELTHRAQTRDTFARGAARAAAWVAGRKPGLYTVADALGIEAR